LFDGGVSDGTRVVSYPRRIWFGASLVVAFSLLLWTAEAIVSVTVVDTDSLAAKSSAAFAKDGSTVECLRRGSTLFGEEELSL